MRKMILAGLAALAVTVAVAPDAQAYWYHHYRIRRKTPPFMAGI